MKHTQDKKNKLPDGWCWVRLGEVAELINGRAYRASELLDEGKYPVLRVGNLFTSDHWYHSDLELGPDKYCDKGDLLYAWSASFGPFIWPGPRAVFHYHIWKVKCGSRLDVEYARYALETVTNKIRDESHGLAMLHMTKNGMEQVEIPLPPLEEQRRIAAVLNEQIMAVDKARESAKARSEGIKALPAAFLRQVFPQSDHSLPNNWRWMKLGEVCEGSGQYGTSMRSNSDQQGVPVLGMYHIHEGRIRWENVSYMDLPADELPKYLLHKGDLLFNRTNSAELVGKTAVYDCDEKAVFASYLIRFRFGVKANSHYVSAFINSHEGRRFIERNMARAVGQVNISASVMRNMPIPIPPISEQQRIAELLMEQMVFVDNARTAAKEELNTINALPAALLRGAFNGEL